MDKYDEQIARLREKPEDIRKEWGYGGGIFGFATKTRQTVNSDGNTCGCLTMVRDGFNAETPELTEAIRADGRIPTNACEITIDDLPIFAEWQRKMDAMWGRE